MVDDKLNARKVQYSPIKTAALKGAAVPIRF